MEHHRHPERLKALKRVTLTNAGLAVFSLGTAVVTGNKAFIAEALHDIGDTATQGSRYLVETTGINQNTPSYRRIRQATFVGLSALSAWAAVRLGISWSEGSKEAVEGWQGWAQAGGASVTAAGNVYSYAQTHKIAEEHHSHATKDSHNHNQTDMIASVGLAASIMIEAAGVDYASQAGGVGFAAFTAVDMFRHAMSAKRS